MNVLEGMNFKQNFLMPTSEDVARQLLAYCTSLNKASHMGTRNRNMGNSCSPLLFYVGFFFWESRVCFVSRRLT